MNRSILPSNPVASLCLIASVFLLTFFSCGESDKGRTVSDKDSSVESNSHGEHATASGSPAVGDYARMVNDGTIKDDTMKGSPHRTAMANVGKTHVHITYSSPGVKSRVIWGGLVAYDKVWAAGAHMATKINFNTDITIDGKKVPAGDYGFFVIPGKGKWILILNKNHDQHLADEYREVDDVVRLTVVPKKNEKPVPRLTYTVNETAESAGDITMQWENIEVSLPFATK